MVPRHTHNVRRPFPQPQGHDQLFNAALALCTLESFCPGRFPRQRVRGQERACVGKVAGEAGAVRKPGKPLVLIDGAHNPNGAAALAAYLKSHFVNRKKMLIFGVMKDKDFREMLRQALSWCSR